MAVIVRSDEGLHARLLLPQVEGVTLRYHVTIKDGQKSRRWACEDRAEAEALAQRAEAAGFHVQFDIVLAAR